MARPRSSEAHDKVLRAALDLFAERGIDATSMDAITQASGVSKATIYNHWSDKEALLMEVMEMIHGLNREPEDVQTGDILRDLTYVLTRKPPDEFDEVRRRLMPAMIAYSAVHQEFGMAWRRRVMEPGRRAIQHVLRNGIDRGLLPKDLDIEVAISLLLGPVIYTHIFQKDRVEKTPDIGPKAAESFWRAYSQARKDRIEQIGIRKSNGAAKKSASQKPSARPKH
ncbi:MAG TPA: TetR/AcrR family transcriptional regulator [Terracidiphilus sp.]|jgi:AcrR family transcriptional regulator|nr:TetR/AcrR family transcriptional regulator [Terracidiphilus sp.]